jgi:hypothetical protein
MMEHDKVERSDAREERPEQDHPPGVHLVLVRYVWPERVREPVSESKSRSHREFHKAAFLY